MQYAPRMRLTPGYSSRPMSTKATPWKGSSGFSSTGYTHTHQHQTWLDVVPRFVRATLLTMHRQYGTETTHENDSEYDNEIVSPAWYLLLLSAEP